MIPLAPLVAARTPPIALTGFRARLPPRDLLAILGDVFGGQTRWEIPQALREFSTQLLVLLAASQDASSSSVRCARCRPFTESAIGALGAAKRPLQLPQESRSGPARCQGDRPRSRSPTEVARTRISAVPAAWWRLFHPATPTPLLAWPSLAPLGSRVSVAPRGTGSAGRGELSQPDSSVVTCPRRISRDSSAGHRSRPRNQDDDLAGVRGTIAFCNLQVSIAAQRSARNRVALVCLCQSAAMRQTLWPHHRGRRTVATTPAAGWMGLQLVEALGGVLHRDEPIVGVGLLEDSEGDEFGELLR